MERLGDLDDEFVMYPYAAMGYAGALQVRSGVDLTQSHTWDSSTTTYNYNTSPNALAVDRANSRLYWAHRGGSGYAIQRFDYNLSVDWTGDGVAPVTSAGAEAGLALAGSTLWRFDAGGAANDLSSYTSLASNPPTTGTAYDPNGSSSPGAFATNVDATELFWMDNAGLVSIATIAGISGAADYTYDLAASPTAPWVSEVRPKLIACPTTTDEVWCVSGYNTAVQAGKNGVVKLDKTGVKTAEIDCSDLAFVRANEDKVVNIGSATVDKHGDIYILLRAVGYRYSWCVARYTSAGVYINDSWSQGVVINTAKTSSDVPCSLTVTGLNGYIIIGDGNGKVRSISQA